MAGVSNADSCEAITSSSTIGLWVFLAWSRLFFWLLAIVADLHNRSIICQFYHLIIPTPATIIDRPRLLSIARDYYRSPATIIDRPQLERANNLLIMITAAGGRVRRRRTLPPLPLVWLSLLFNYISTQRGIDKIYSLLTCYQCSFTDFNYLGERFEASRNHFKYGGAHRNQRLGTERSLLIGGDINEQIDWLNQESPRFQAGECQIQHFRLLWSNTVYLRPNKW